MRSWKRRLRRLLWARYLYSPLFLGVYALAWLSLSRLCAYGSVLRNLPVLALCALFFLGYLAALLCSVSRHKRRSPVQEPVRELTLLDNRVELPGGESFDYQEIRWYKKQRDRLLIFLKKGRFVWLELGDLQEKKREYLELKLTQRGIFATHFWKLPTALLLIAVTAAGAYGVGRSAMPYSGRLSSVIRELQSSRRVRLVHDNLYEDGLDGIFSDIRSKVDLPERLCLINSFNLHFAADGTVLTLDTFVKGVDENGQLTDTYLISYDSSNSDKITVWLGGESGGFGDAYEPEKDLEPLFAAMRVIPLEETVSGWQEEVYGILYYGERSWGYNTEGICYIGPEGVVTYPEGFPEQEIRGPSISVFCPEHEEITPVRYLYRGIL